MERQRKIMIEEIKGKVRDEKEKIKGGNRE